MAPLPEELEAHGLNRTEQPQSYPKLRKSDLWRRMHGVAPPTLPLDVERTKTVRSGSSGSADYAGLRAQGRVAVPPTLPLDVERTETVRPGPSGSADHAGLHAQGRVAVPPTLPLDVERTGSTPSHCHSTSNVPKMSRCLPVISRTRKRWSSCA